MFKSTLFIVSLLVAGPLAISIKAQGNGSAEQQSTLQSSIDSSKSKVNEIDQRLKILERLREIDAENNKKKVDETPVVTAGKDGFLLRAPDTSYQLRIRYEGHFDGRYFVNSDTFSTTRQPVFLVRRARPIIEAQLPGHFFFRIMADFGNGKLDIPDAYIENNLFSAVGARIGKFKSPFSLEVLQSTTANPFIELSLSSQLAPNRDIGGQLQGDIGNGLVSYAIGVFNGTADGTNIDGDWNRPKDLAGRIFVQPFPTFPALKGLGIGGAFTYGDHSDPRDPKKWSSTITPASVSGLKTAGQESFFKYRDTTYASGDETRLDLQGNYYVGPFGLTGEYINNKSFIKLKTQKEITNTGWNVSVIYALTGEPNSFKGLKPFRNFNPVKGQWGALELAARVSSVEVDNSIFPVFADSTKQAKKAIDYTGGINWYLNRHIKILLDYTQTQFTGGAKKGNAPDENLIAGRVQVVY